MKKLSGSIRPEIVLLVFALVSALGIGFCPPPAASMDVQLVLATEEVVKEMKENGELTERTPVEPPPFPGIIPPAEVVPPAGEGTVDPVAPGSDPEGPVQISEPTLPADREEPIAEAEVISEPAAGELAADTEEVPEPAPGEAVVEVTEAGPGEMVVETEVVPAAGPEKEAAESGAALAAETAPAPVPILKESLERRVTLKYVDTDIRVVLRSLARAYAFNITLAPEVQGKVTVDFIDVRIKDILEAILIDRGYGYQVSGEIIRVTTREKIQQETAASAARETVAAQKATAEAEKRTAEEVVEPLVVEIFDLKYIDADDARAAIEPLLTAGRGKATVLKTRQYRGFEFEATESFAVEGEKKEVSEFVRSRVLIVQDIRAVLDRVAEVIKSIDRRPPQILIDAKIIEVPVNQEFRLGINWTEALNGWNVTFTELKAAFGKTYESEDWRINETQNKLESTQEENYKTYDKLNYTDYQGYSISSRQQSSNLAQQASENGIPSQLKEVSRYSISENLGQNIREVSRERGWDDSQSEKILDTYVNNIQRNIYSLATAGQGYGAVLTAADFKLMLSAMQTDDNIVILSNPRIIVHENYAAKIFVGERYPILSTEVGGDGGGAVGGTSVDEWREIGITLKVIPQVRTLLSGGMGINMIIHPAVSKRTGQYAEYRSESGQLAYSSYPVIDIREADTNVTINDGDTIVIGGLISSYTEDKESKIPLLGDIPILGYLFKEEYSKVEKRNLMIFITARLVTEETQFSAYEKVMLEKATPESLGDVRYLEDSRVRPYLYRPPAESAPAEGETSPPADTKPAQDSGVEEGNQGNFQGRVITKAMKRSRR